MDFLKRQLFMIICVVVSAGSIALGVVGVTSMSAVKEQMRAAADRASRLDRVRGPGGIMINGESIRAQRQRIEASTGQYQRVLEWAYGRNRMEPLLPDCFPDPNLDRQLAFREAYFARFGQLLDKLHAGTVATPDEIAMAKEQMAEEAKAQLLFGVDKREAAKSGESTGGDANQPIQEPSGLLTDYGASQIPEARATLIKARKMLCYATEGSLEILRGVGNGVAPHPADMWDAQLSLWIQESVVDALARINERTAAAIRQQNETPWVAQMPVKELISIRSGNGYLTTATEPRAPSEPTGDAPAKPPESFAEVFTHTVSNDLYDTVQFTVKMVVDARTLPAIVEEICKDNFHTLLRMSYEDVSTNQALFTMTDRIYGSHPTIRVVMDFETVFFGEPYRSLMPNDVRVALGLPEPQPQ